MLKIETVFCDLEKIADSGQCFRWKKTGERAYEIPAYGKVLRVKQPEANGLLEMECSQEEFDTVWRGYFDFECDYSKIAEKFRTEITPRYLVEAEKAARGIRILKQELWETVVSFIISQNNNIPRIKQSIERVCEQYGYLPTPDDINGQPDKLGACGLGYRDKYLLGAAEYFVNPEAEAQLRAMNYAGAKAKLMELKGVGSKVADCICLFGLGHKEAFPRDVWIKRIEAEQFEGHFPEERYGDYAGIIQQYIFYYERSRKHGGN